MPPRVAPGPVGGCQLRPAFRCHLVPSVTGWPGWGQPRGQHPHPFVATPWHPGVCAIAAGRAQRPSASPCCCPVPPVSPTGCKGLVLTLLRLWGSGGIQP